MPRISHAAFTAGADGQRGLVEHDREPGGVGELVERGGETAARRVAHASAAPPSGEQRRRELVHRRGVALDVGLERELAAGDHHRHAVVGERAGEEHAVARPHVLAARARRRPATAPAPAVVM